MLSELLEMSHDGVPTRLGTLRAKAGVSEDGFCWVWGLIVTWISRGQGFGTRHFGMYSEKRVSSMKASQRTFLSVSLVSSNNAISIMDFSPVCESPTEAQVNSYARFFNLKQNDCKEDLGWQARSNH